MNRIVTACALVAILLLNSGCASYLSYRSSFKEIQRERVYASGDEHAIRMLQRGYSCDDAIRAVKIGEEDGVGVAVDVSVTEALAQHPWRQVGAALLDLATMYGAYEGARALQKSSNKDDDGDDITVNTTGDGNSTTVVNGDGNSDNGSGNNTSSGSGNNQASGSGDTDDNDDNRDGSDNNDQ